MALEKVSIEKAKEIAGKIGLKPTVVKNTEILRFAKKSSENLEEITWEKFDEIAKKSKVAVYVNGTWMKIMKEK